MLPQELLVTLDVLPTHPQTTELQSAMKCPLAEGMAAKRACLRPPAAPFKFQKGGERPKIRDR